MGYMSYLGYMTKTPAVDTLVAMAKMWADALAHGSPMGTTEQPELKVETPFRHQMSQTLPLSQPFVRVIIRLENWRHMQPPSRHKFDGGRPNGPTCQKTINFYVTGNLRQLVVTYGNP